MSSVPHVQSPAEALSGGREAPDSATPAAWQRQLADALRTPQQLLSRLEIPHQSDAKTLVDSEFRMLVPESFVRRMKRGDPQDPLLRQVLPAVEETRVLPGFTSDPVDDQSARQAPGLLQKYAGRALLVTTGACAVHCRYCFRREYPYHEEPRRLDDWNDALQQIESDITVNEVILSGGDPLMLNDDRLTALCERIDAISHVRRLRVHTRLPIVLPARVTTELLNLLRSLSSQPVMVVHANHPNEVAADCESALREFVQAGIPTLNQAVLLKGVNDTVDALQQLCNRLVNVGVMPYYLHQLDRVNGAAHFEVSPATGKSLVHELAARLPGYAVPRYVQEVPGALGKTPLG